MGNSFPFFCEKNSVSAPFVLKTVVVLRIDQIPNLGRLDPDREEAILVGMIVVDLGGARGKEMRQKVN